MSNTILKAKNLNKTYFSGSIKNTVIDDLSLQFYEGEFTVIMGSSGSGKSTLLYLLSGLDGPTSGKIWFRDSTLHDKSETALALHRRKGLGFVFQNSHLVPNLTLFENVLLPGYLLGGEKKIVRSHAEELLKKTELWDLRDRLPGQLSSGQQQRGAIVRALINSPDVLMADEPTGSLNSSASEMVLNIFSQFHAMGQTILMVTHDLKSACRGDRIKYFNDGKVVDDLYFEIGREHLQARENILKEWLSQKGW